MEQNGKQIEICNKNNVSRFYSILSLVLFFPTERSGTENIDIFFSFRSVPCVLIFYICLTYLFIKVVWLFITKNSYGIYCGTVNLLNRYVICSGLFIKRNGTRNLLNRYVISIYKFLARFRRYVKGSSYPKRNGTRIC